MQSVVCTYNHQHRAIDFTNSLSRRHVLLPTKNLFRTCFPCGHHTPWWISPLFLRRGSNYCHTRTSRHRAICLTICLMVLLYLSNLSLLYMNLSAWTCRGTDVEFGVCANFVASVLFFELYMGSRDNTQVTSLTWQVSSSAEPPWWPPGSLFKLTLAVSCQEEKKVSGFHFCTNSSSLGSVSPLLFQHSKGWRGKGMPICQISIFVRIQQRPSDPGVWMTCCLMLPAVSARVASTSSGTELWHCLFSMV